MASDASRSVKPNADSLPSIDESFLNILSAFQIDSRITASVQANAQNLGNDIADHQRPSMNGETAKRATEKSPPISSAELLSSFRALAGVFDSDRELEEEISLDRCRKCSENFEYSYEGWSTTVIAGIPKEPGYKAVSYVWGKVAPLVLRCLKCGSITRAPMESSQKFRQLMGLTDVPGQKLWLDALSIDQSDPKDIASQLAVMGSIFRNASSVAVFLPRCDEEAFMLLIELAQVAAAINNHHADFVHNNTQNPSVLIPHPGFRNLFQDDPLSKACRRFYALIDKFEKKLDNWAYWRRAWTFQEWALARNFSLSWEGLPGVNLANYKTSVLQAATTMAVYKMRYHQTAEIKLGFTRGEVPRRFETIKRLFPDETSFLPADLIDEREVHADALSSSMRFRAALGLRAYYAGNLTGQGFQPDPRARIEASLAQDYLDPSRKPLLSNPQLERLSMALNSLGTSKREARFEADLVASWASMCNINYEYNKDDTFPVALQKVLKTLRKDGIRLYNFLANTRGSSGEVDTRFLEYATGHKQCNATNNAYFHGTPVFTGRADTAIHLRLAISEPRVKPYLKGSGIELRRVKHSSITETPNLVDSEIVLELFYPAVSGTADGNVFTQIGEDVKWVLKKARRQDLEEHKLVLAKVPLQTESGTHNLAAWAICSTDVDKAKLFVAREGLNGTLVLAMPSEEEYEVVAYLTLTDELSGTYLVKVDEHGRIDMEFLTPLRGDMVDANLLGDRSISGNILVEAEAFQCF